MTTKSLLLALSVMVAGPAQAGGFLSDTIPSLSPGVADQLDSSHKSLDSALSGAPPSVIRSATCVTPRGLCPVPNSALNGNHSLRRGAMSFPCGGGHATPVARRKVDMAT